MEPLLALFPCIALSMMRPLGVFLLLPLFGSRSLGGTLIRNALVLVIALPVMPLNFKAAPIIIDELGQLLQLYGRELFIGMLIGFGTTVPFWALDIASYVIDTMRGASMGSLLNPLLGEQSSIFGVLFAQLYAVLFLSFGGLHHLLTALYTTYRLLPPGQPLHLDEQFFLLVQQLWLLMFHLSLSFAIPAILVMILVDVAMGLLNRSAQQLNVFFLAMPIKSALTLLLLAVSLQSALQFYKQRSMASTEQILQLLQSSAMHSPPPAPIKLNPAASTPAGSTPAPSAGE